MTESNVERELRDRNKWEKDRTFQRSITNRNETLIDVQLEKDMNAVLQID